MAKPGNVKLPGPRLIVRWRQRTICDRRGQSEEEKKHTLDAVLEL